MGIFELALVIGFVWFAAIAVFVAIATVAGRSDHAHDQLICVAAGAPQALPASAPAAQPADRSATYAPLHV